MDISKFKLVAGMVLVALAPANIALAQENAIGGQVRLRGSEKPLGHAKITVAQKPEIHDITDVKDGVYVLLIPKSLKQFDLIYEHDNCFRVADEGILNEQAQNKRPVRELRSTSTAAVRTLTAADVDEIVSQSQRMIVEGTRNQTLALLYAGQANRLALSVAAQSIGKEARIELDKGQVAKAEESYKISLAILQRAEPLSETYAGMLDQYASLLRKTGQAAVADQQVAQAKEVRRLSKSFGAAASSNWNAYFEREFYAASRQQFVLPYLYDEFALEHIDSLPNLAGTITVLSDTDGQYGRISVPGKGAASFRIHLAARRVPFLRILMEKAVPFEVEVTGQDARVELTRVGNRITWQPTNVARTFTVTISNKNDRKEDYVVHLLAQSPAEKFLR